MSLRRPDQPRVHPVPEILEKARKRTAAANVQATMAHHRGLARSLGQLYDTILRNCVTPRRLRELVILRTGWNCQAEYEFGQHTLMGREAGVTDEELHALTRPLKTHAWSDADRALLQMADDLYTDFCVSEATWGELTSRWTTEEILEFLSAALGYFVVSGLLNTLGVQLDEGVPGWPESAERS
jgi:4-carboxymuconolactone decarboxylase